MGRAARRARHVHRRRPAVPRARVRRRRAPRGRVGLPLLRRPQPRGQGRAGHVLHRGAVEGRHDGLRRGLRAGRAAPRRGPVLPDVDDVRDGLAADRGRPPLPGPQRGLEGRARPADGRGVRARATPRAPGRSSCATCTPPTSSWPRPCASAATSRRRCRSRWSTSRSPAATSEWLAELSVKARVHQRKVGAAVRRRLRRRVPAAPAGATVSDAELDHLYGLYLARAGARARPELVPAAAHLPARHALAPVLGADDAAAAARPGRSPPSARTSSARATTRR